MAGTGIVLDPRYLEHRPPHAHPENPERLGAVHAGLEAAGLLGRARRIPPRAATPEEILLNHGEQLLESVKQTATRNTTQIDPDTYACARSYETALLAAGGVLELVDRVQAGELDNGFALVRPPGHHAEAARSMGFCLFNNVAIAAAYAKKKYGIERVLAIDWDVHHGNGTQASFYTTSETLYFSSHRYPFYPGTGAVEEVGRGEGRGYTINIPMSGGMGDGEIVPAFRRLLEPIAERYAPQIVLVSAGFDAHELDPLGGMSVTTEGFAALARIVKGVARESAGGKLVLALEGGYSQEGLAESVAAVMEVLLEDDGSPAGGADPTPAESPIGRELVEYVRKTQRKYWKSLD